MAERLSDGACFRDDGEGRAAIQITCRMIAEVLGQIPTANAGWPITGRLQITECVDTWRRKESNYY
jgi:hypothetical protein